MLLFIVSSCTVVSIVVYLCLEEGRTIVISVLVISVLYGYSMVLYIILVVGRAAGEWQRSWLQRFIRTRIDPRPKAQEEA